ncbi:uncharacterized protein LOC117105035 [Anneissia japonica]|uniref:uncharacterized protein LOC117105035 n=1 Tax=Anneissia japonica TaxID=1529436 RepID=UPI001425520E|nr:uncharacterized protein LOC117105035 [Anneissia japonica]
MEDFETAASRRQSTLTFTEVVVIPRSPKRVSLIVCKHCLNVFIVCMCISSIVCIVLGAIFDINFLYIGLTVLACMLLVRPCVDRIKYCSSYWHLGPEFHDIQESDNYVSSRSSSINYYYLDKQESASKRKPMYLTQISDRLTCRLEAINEYPPDYSDASKEEILEGRSENSVTANSSEGSSTPPMYIDACSGGNTPLLHTRKDSEEDTEEVDVKFTDTMIAHETERKKN